MTQRRCTFYHRDEVGAITTWDCAAEEVFIQLLVRNEQIEVLRRIPLFSELSKRELNLIARKSDQVKLAAGSVLAREGELGREFMVLLQGKVRVEKLGELIRRLGTGDYFGEISMIDPGLRTASVVADTEVCLMVLDARSFNYLMDQVPGLAKKMLRTVCRYLHQVDEIFPRRA